VISHHLVRIDKPVLRIPMLAIHLQVTKLSALFTCLGSKCARGTGAPPAAVLASMSVVIHPMAPHQSVGVHQQGKP
jgi:hypothetical protein